MDVQVNRVDIRELELPANAQTVTVLLSCALVVYMVATAWRLWRHNPAPSMPLLYQEAEL